MNNDQSSPPGGAQDDKSKPTKTIGQCKICLEHKPKIFKGYFKNLQKKWLDDQGLQWTGNICPECQKKKMRNHQRNKRMINGQSS